MVVLRLFAAAREAAGTTSVEVTGRTVDEVLDEARARFGSAFATVLETAAVWRNGRPARGDDPVADGDEVAVLPPVSGGAGTDEPTGGVDPAASVARPSVIRRNFTPSPPKSAPTPTSARPASASPPTSARPASASPPTSARPASAPTRAPRPPAGGRVPPAAPPLAPALTPTRLTRIPTVTGAPPDPEDPSDAPPPRDGPLARLRSVPVPVTGHVYVGGHRRAVAGPRPRKSAFGRRYAVAYDTSGWKATFGILWFVAVIGALVTGWAVLTFMYAVAAGWAAMEASFRWRERGVAADPWVAALGGAVVGASAAAGYGYMGAAILATVAVAVAHTAFSDIHRHHSLSAAGNTVGCAVPFGLAAGCVVLTRDLEIGAAVVLVLFVAAYDVGDYLIGSGASNSLEGPLTGIVTVVVVAMVVAVLRVPPFDGPTAFVFAALAAVLAPAGQLAASAVLPAANAHAPSVRRLDSLLLLAPVWLVAVDLLV